MAITRTRNRINHFILNRIMMLRYHVRRRPVLVCCLIGVEALLVRTGLIYNGCSHARLNGKG
jgi:hypothetical protein